MFMLKNKNKNVGSCKFIQNADSSMCMNVWAKVFAGVPDFQSQPLKLTDKPHHCGLVKLTTGFVCCMQRQG